MEYFLLIPVTGLILLASYLVYQSKEQKKSKKLLVEHGYRHVFSGDGNNFIAFDIENGMIRFGQLSKYKYEERPITYLTNYEWKWTEHNAVKVTNKFFLYISDVDHSMHEIFYGGNERLAEVEWAKFQAVVSECTAGQYREIKNMERHDSYDFFVSHASEDKDEFVRPLVKAMSNLGLNIWYDEFSLEIGDSLRRTIDHGLGSSRYGIVILSKAFFDKQWPQYELDALVNKSMSGQKVILPVWHGVEHQEVSNYSHSLAGKVAFSSSHLSVEDMAKEFLKLIQKNS
ncbi:toll/interleukin-1 receptor domain-containing protein [Pseudoalteromonas luteoviolacea]|uniref:TIR domain-containing protein n=1 Tax=Pseudoalteromonas luteoviolacea S4054 TaxID=1129367 RepID=A0A0F6AID2_9GAMM|nr:toll/interleukin-1 receptor domain-containing protein [Pseudoalteromonas luteoviolacea]AOT08722.1 hypothetical protein S4054249_13045 [Pseudoalteromonas luteoviolacea]AOT13637.1 hypothetical protein S40542_13020 [Pseudoalteromonas luteoviolacea]AOT18550.1 hypothetical protein S4054_13020 [Pseudoalteromonas luteoviolacea]KKE85616.1 hypothetical protein N479_25465 [Pseudoalteromonas luteoviolacea S4054]KZN68181.1 hypothetical protein N481_23305 [Pseudoalteromonas luteoviolacea S4047-1]